MSVVLLAVTAGCGATSTASPGAAGSGPPPASSTRTPEGVPVTTTPVVTAPVTTAPDATAPDATTTVAPDRGAGPAGTVATTGASSTTTGAAHLTLLTEPAAGPGPIYALITGARHSVDLTMYELVDPTAEADLAADAARGVTVRVILDQHLERSRNTPAYDYLSAHGVHVVWAAPSVTFHQKTLTVDSTTSVVMTLNLVSEDYTGTRDFAVVDTQPADVAAIEATFDADFAGTPVTPPTGLDLVWSPTNSGATILGIIDGATTTLAVENEEMDDDDVTDALEAAARRGVDVTVTMTEDSEWDGAFDRLAAAGVHVATYADDATSLYIHAKAVVADAGHPGAVAFVGSENFSVASLDYNRELGIRTADGPVVDGLATTLAADHAGARPW